MAIQRLQLHFTQFCFLSLFIGVNYYGVHGEDLMDFKLFKGVSNVPQYFLINRTNPHAHLFTVTNIKDLSRANLRVETSVLPTNLRSDEKDCPVIFSVRQARSAKSWALPLQLFDDSLDNSTQPTLVFDGSHTICVDTNSTNSKKFSNEFLVIASTCSDTNFNYSINFVANSSDTTFVLKVDEPLTHVDLSPSTTRFFRFDFEETSDQVVVQLESMDNEICMTAAVQSSWCSLVNAASNSQYFEKDGLKFQSFWQDMTKKGIIPVSKSDFPQGSFFIGFTVHSSKKRCEGYNGVSANNWTPLKSVSNNKLIGQKVISIKITEQLPTKEYLMPILYPLFYSLGLIFVTLIIFVSFSCFESTHHQKDSYSNGKFGGSKLNDDQEEQSTLVHNDELQIDGQTDKQNDDDDDDGSEISCQEPNQMNSTTDILVVATSSFSSGQVSPWKNEGRMDDDGQYEKNQTMPADQFHSLQNSLIISSNSGASSSVHLDDPPPILPDQNDFTFEHTSVTITVPTERPNLNGDVDPEAMRKRTSQQWLTIEAFIHKTEGQLKQTSMDKTYLLIFIVGIFYVVPTVQLLYTYHQISISTGQKDLCYRNYECSQRIWGWDDFNHIYSNIVYITAGLTFCLFVQSYQRKVRNFEETRRQKLMAESPSSSSSSSSPSVGNFVSDAQYGVLNEFGVFYGLGCALILEGILSGSYHVCPTHLNFQFDTSFMYILAVLSTIKIYQKRRSCPICLHKTFGLLAFIAFTSVVGLILGNKIYESVFFTVHFMGVVYLAIYMYYVGHIKDSDGNAVTGSAMLSKIQFRNALFSEPFSRPRHGMRLFYLVPFILFNFGLNIWQFQAQNDFPTYLFYLFVGNMMLYFAHYLAMKVFHGEMFNVRSAQAFIYLTASIVLGIWSILNFMDKRYSANLSPSKSRDMNRPCDLANFYDTHDIWHFLSAASIFFFFMTLLTIDDGIFDKPRRDIVAF